MSQVTNPIILNSTGQDIALALAGLATAIANKPDPATQTPAMDGAGNVGASTKYAREDHQHPSDTSKANQSQLAYVETGTTASQNYTAGQYISLNGLLYTADTAIASGATFYTSGGNKNLTECVGGVVNEVLFVDIPYNSFEWFAGLPAFRALYTVPTGYYIAAINVFFTNGSAIAGPRYSSGYIYITGLNGRGQTIDSTYEFVCTVMLRRT